MSFIGIGVDMEVACCVWSKDTKRRKCISVMWSVDCDIRVSNVRTKDWVVLKAGNGISISMIRLYTDVSGICNRKPWIPGAGCHSRAIFVLSIEILLYRHIVGCYYIDDSYNIWLNWSVILARMTTQYFQFTPYLKYSLMLNICIIFNWWFTASVMCSICIVLSCYL